MEWGEGNAGAALHVASMLWFDCGPTAPREAEMRVFVTGANGFIGGAVASALIADGHKVRGLVRDKVQDRHGRTQGIEPVVGSLDDAALLQAEARAADAVVNAASSDHRDAVEVLLAGLAGSGKRSGSSIV